jgi:hypothetical protein
MKQGQESRNSKLYREQVGKVTKWLRTDLNLSLSTPLEGVTLGEDLDIKFFRHRKSYSGGAKVFEHYPPAAKP